MNDILTFLLLLLLFVVATCSCLDRYNIGRWEEHVLLFGRCRRVFVFVGLVWSDIGMGSKKSIQKRHDCPYYEHMTNAGAIN